MTISNSQESVPRLFAASDKQLWITYHTMVTNANWWCCYQRTDFWIISITWLWFFTNLCFFLIFLTTEFFALLKIDCFFFLAIILIMIMFNFQFWGRINIGSWYYLTCCTFLLFNVLLNKSNCFGTVELHVQFTVTLFNLTAVTDLILYCFNLLYCWSNWTEYYFLHLLSLFARSQVFH